VVVFVPVVTADDDNGAADAAAAADVTDDNDDNNDDQLPVLYRIYCIQVSSSSSSRQCRR